jgi:hypothetical protein
MSCHVVSYHVPLAIDSIDHPVASVLVEATKLGNSLWTQTCLLEASPSLRGSAHGTHPSSVSECIWSWAGFQMANNYQHSRFLHPMAQRLLRLFMLVY